MSSWLLSMAVDVKQNWSWDANYKKKRRSRVLFWVFAVTRTWLSCHHFVIEKDLSYSKKPASRFVHIVHLIQDRRGWWDCQQHEVCLVIEFVVQQGWVCTIKGGQHWDLEFDKGAKAKADGQSVLFIVWPTSLQSDFCFLNQTLTPNHSILTH